MNGAIATPPGRPGKKAREYLLPSDLRTMEIHLNTEDSIRLVDAGDGFTFESGGAASLSPFHLLAASLATCTYAVLQSYGQNARIPLDGIAIDVSWEFGSEPYRVTAMDMVLHWPALPEERQEAARRAAAQCTVHHTLGHGTQVQTLLGDREERS